MWTNICMRPCLSMQCKLGFYLNHLLNFSGVYHIFCDVFHLIPYVIFVLNVDPWLLLPNKHFMTCLQPRKQHGIVIYACFPLFFLLRIFPENTLKTLFSTDVFPYENYPIICFLGILLLSDMWTTNLHSWIDLWGLRTHRYMVVFIARL